MPDLSRETKTAADAEPNKPVIPDHDLVRRIGKGSYGEVWLARNNATGQYRAVKVVYRDKDKTSRPFDQEFSGIKKYEPISRSHPGLVNILHVGINQNAGYFYYIMELADASELSGTGVSARESAVNLPIDPTTYTPKTLFSEQRSRKQLPVEECLQIGLTLTAALDYLHGKGLIHRDIKLSNIIIVNGQPKLADIGLVASAESAMSYVGTEGYIPPEGPGKPQADIYALGKVLYEISTGKDRTDFPDFPTDFDSIPDRARWLKLNEVVLTACKTDPAKRYQSASDFRVDCLLLQEGKSLKRKRPAHRLLIATAATCCIVFIAAVAASYLTEKGVFAPTSVGDQTRGTAALPDQSAKRKDYFLDNCQKTYLSPGGIGPTLEEGRHFRLTYWNLPRTIRPGQPIESRLSWETVSGNANAVVYVTVIGDWQPDKPLVDLYQGNQGEPGKQVERTFEFKAPQEPGRYRLRWILTQAFRPITKFYGQEHHDANDPGHGWWSEVDFYVESN